MFDGERMEEVPAAGYPRPDPVRATRSGAPRPSSKRPAPTPPGPRRVVSTERVVPGHQRDSRDPRDPREVGPHRRGSSVDGLDSSFSDAEGLLNERNQVNVQ